MTGNESGNDRHEKLWSAVFRDLMMRSFLVVTSSRGHARAQREEERSALDLDDAEEDERTAPAPANCTSRDRVELVLATTSRIVAPGAARLRSVISLYVSIIPSLTSYIRAEVQTVDALRTSADGRVDCVRFLPLPLIGVDRAVLRADGAAGAFSGSMQKSTSAVQARAGSAFS